MNPIEQIKDRLSILDVVSVYVRLEKSGSQYKGRCPFHNEKTPSFYISPEYGSFNCFGCGKRGDILTFVSEIEHITFRESLEILAEKAGVDLRKNTRDVQDVSLVSILDNAKRHYQNNLKNSPSALEYLHSRGVTDESIDTFALGFSKPEWRDAMNALEKLGYTREDIHKSGITISSERGYYDRWRNRIMFPINTASSKCIGFTGRILPDGTEKTATAAKYVNSPENDIYHKSKVIYGYDLAKKSMSDTRECILVEGQLDVMLVYQAGNTNTIAVSGTAFSDDQIRQIKRLAETVILALDSDKAGKAAQHKIAKLLLLAELSVLTVALPEGKDPADIVKDDVVLWRKILSEKKDIISASILDSRNIPDPKERVLSIKSTVFPLIASVRSSMQQTQYLEEVARVHNIPLESVISDFTLAKSLLSEELPRQEHVTPVQQTNPTLEYIAATVALISTSEKALKKIHDFSEEIEFESSGLIELPNEIVAERVIAIKEQLQKVTDKSSFLQNLEHSCFEELISKRIQELKESPEHDLHTELLLLKKRDIIRKAR